MGTDMGRLNKLGSICLGISLLVITMVWACGGVDNEVIASTTSTFLTDVPTGTGTLEDPYQICKIEHLDYVRDHLDKHYILINDLAFLSPEDYVNIENITAWTTGEGWLPIGDNSKPFAGTFNANGHVIKGLYIYRDRSYQGLFGYTAKDCLITNGKLENVWVKGGQNTGALAGLNCGSISNFAVQGEVQGASYVGGLVGQSEGIIRVASMVGTVAGKNSVGGLVGYTTGGSIDESYSLVTVKGVGSVGGLVGNHWGSLTSNSYAIGDITKTKNLEYAGGLVGLYSRGQIKNCYAVGTVTGSGNVGGLVGFRTTNNPEVINSYYDSTMLGYSDIGKGAPKTTAEMKSPETFTNWGFKGEEAIWSIVNTPTHYSYPYLINNVQYTYPGHTIRAPKIITAFAFDQLTPAVNGIIDQENKTINVVVPHGTDLTTLIPTITYNGQTISAPSETGEPLGFSNPVEYTVTAEDESQQTYTVTVMTKEKDPLLESINGVDSITVAYGSSSADAIAALPAITTITDSKGDAHLVNLTWVLNNYDGYMPGEYLAKGTFLLPIGVQQAEPAIELQVFALVQVQPQPVAPYTPPSAGSSRQGGNSSVAKDTTTTANSTMLTQTSTIIKTWAQLSSWIILQVPIMIGL